MTTATADLPYALMAARDLPQAENGAEVPEWVHLAPIGELETFDDRGPYRLDDPEAVIAASFARRGDIEIDVNHATWIAAPMGIDAPSRGWIVEMQAREDGIWGRVNWTDEGRQLVANRAYRRISPVFELAGKGSKKVVSILNVSLVNRQNLRGLAALNAEMESGMQEVLAKLKQMLGLAEDAEDDEIWRSLSAVIDAAAAEKAKNASMPEMQAAMGEIGQALGLDLNAAPEVIVEAARAARAGVPDEVAALQSEVAGLTRQLNDLQSSGLREKAEAYIDGEIKRGRAGLKPSRDRFVTMHMEDAENARAIVEAMPVLAASPTADTPPAANAGEIALNAEQIAAAKLMGVSPDDYAKTLEAERNEETAR